MPTSMKMPERQSAAAILLRYKDTKTLGELFVANGFTSSAVSDDLQHPDHYPVLTNLTRDPIKNRFTSAAYATFVPFSNMPHEIQSTLSPRQTRADFTINTNLPGMVQKSWKLCPEAESLYKDALAEGAVGSVNGISIKYRGRLTGIATETFTTHSGVTFVEGNWYAPYDPRSRDSLREAFIRGGPTEVTLEEGQWRLLRAAADYTALHADTQEYHRSRRVFPDTIGGVSREKFLKKVTEQFELVF